MSFPKKLRVIIYCRFSKEEQRQQSIDAQRLLCERVLKELGIDADITVFSDEGISGELRNRPGIEQVRQLIESEQCDLLISDELRYQLPCGDVTQRWGQRGRDDGTCETLSIRAATMSDHPMVQSFAQEFFDGPQTL